MKWFVQVVVRKVHSTFLNRGLPNKLGVYMHGLERQHFDAFRNMVNFCRSKGYRFVGAREFVEEDDRVAFLSFDDNYVGWHEGLELFDELDVRATFYTNTAPFRDRATVEEIRVYYDERLQYPGPTKIPLSTQELKEIHAAGHTIGAHSHRHLILSKIPPEQAQSEILTSKQILEDLLGEPIVHFSHPYGMRRHFNDDLRKYCLDIGFETVANATPGLQHLEQKLDRIQRTSWSFVRSVSYNEETFSIDGRVFERLTGYSAVG